MAGYDINSINALGSDPMFLAALNAYNPNFMRTQQASQMQQVATNPQVASTTPQQAALTQTTELPKADYSQEADSNTGLVAGLTVTALGAASLIYAAKKGNGEGIIKGFKNIFKGTKNSMTKTAEEVSHKKEALKDIQVVMKNGKPVYYIPNKTVTYNTTADIQNALQGNTKLERQLRSLRFGTGETSITAGTFTLKDGGNANTIIFKGDKIEDIINSSGASLKDKFLENGKIKSDLEDVADNAFARKIEDYISKIKEGNSEIIRGKDTNLRDFTYTTQIGDTSAEIFRKVLSSANQGSTNAEIKKLTALKEFQAGDKEVLAYVRTSRENGKNIDSIISKDFLSKGKVPEGYKVHEFTLPDGKNTIKVVDGKVAGVTIGGKYYSKDTVDCKAYLERNKHDEDINKAIENALKNNKIPKGATIVPA